MWEYYLHRTPKDNPVIENSVNTFHYTFDCQRRCPPTHAANLWYDFSNPPNRSMQTISALSSIGWLGSMILPSD